MGRLTHISKRRRDYRAIRACLKSEIDGCHQCRPKGCDLVSDILDSFKLPEKYHRYACQGLSCPGCEAALASNSWILRCEVNERAFRRSVALGSIKYGARLRSFEHHLSRFPSLGMQHEVGRLIWQQISGFPAKTLQQGSFVRVRRFSDCAGLERIKEQGMWNPDPRKCPVPGGRYNHQGQSFLYLSSDKETAVVETFENPGPDVEKAGRCAIQRFEVGPLGRVLDLTGAVQHSSLLYSALVYEGTLRREVTHSSSWKPEYLVPRFFADVARAKGFDAILYRTSKFYYAEGLNLVVFEPMPGRITDVGDLTICERVKRGEEESFEQWYEIVPGGRADDQFVFGN